MSEQMQCSAEFLMGCLMNALVLQHCQSSLRLKSESCVAGEAPSAEASYSATSSCLLHAAPNKVGPDYLASAVGNVGVAVEYAWCLFYMSHKLYLTHGNPRPCKLSCSSSSSLSGTLNA